MWRHEKNCEGIKGLFAIHIKMTCPQCLRDPFSHSFSYFGSTGEGLSLYYTSPARATAREDNYNIQSLRKHLDEINGPWIWVLDCTNMELHHMYTMRFSVLFADILLQEHSKQLRHILVINPNGWIERVLFGLRQDILSNVRFATKGMELSKACTDYSFPSSAKMWLQLTLTRDPNKRLEKVEKV